MSYLVFARKYRPQTFADILGQGPIVTTLTNTVRQRRIGHAYLFTGPRGTGKTSTARIFAKSLNCVQGSTPTPCLNCPQCQEIAQGRSLDVLEIDGASNRGIDQIRALREHSKFAPAAGTFKIYIIDEVHQITSEGFNALLKILEEPPSHVIFILATTASHKVPATILSRCQRYDFKRLPLEVIIAKLKGIAHEEKLKLDDEAAVGIAKAASGSLRDAESILDQAAAFTGGAIRREDIETLLGSIDEEVFEAAVTAIQKRDPVKLLELIAEATEAGTDLVQWVFEFLSYLRNLLAAKVGAGSLGFEDMGKESIERLQGLAKEISVEQLAVITQTLAVVVETMRRVEESRVPLEIALIRLSAGEPMAPVADLIERLEQVGRELRGTAPGSPARPTAAAPPAPPPLPKSADLEGVLALWPSFLDQLRHQKPTTAAHLSNARPLQVIAGEPTQIVIGLPKGSEFQMESLERLQNRQPIEEILKNLLGRLVRCQFEVSDHVPQPSPFAEPSARSAAASAQKVQASPKEAAGGAVKGGSFVDSVVDMFEGRVLPGGE